MFFHSLTYISQIFVRYLPKWSKPRFLKAEALQILQKVRTMLVWYLLLGIRILVYSFTGCGTSKIIYVSKVTSSFSRVSLKSETKDARPWTVVLFCLQKIWFSENKNLTSNKLKMNKFIFNVKQLKMNKPIKYIWQLIIRISNATLKMPSLCPCF